MNVLMDINNRVMDWFEKNTDLSKDKLKKSVLDNYLEKGLIDSFKFIPL